MEKVYFSLLWLRKFAIYISFDAPRTESKFKSSAIRQYANPCKLIFNEKYKRLKKKKILISLE